MYDVTVVEASPRHLCSVWLQASGRAASDASGFEICLDDPTRTAEADLVTGLRVPLA